MSEPFAHLFDAGKRLPAEVEVSGFRRELLAKEFKGKRKPDERIPFLEGGHRFKRQGLAGQIDAFELSERRKLVRERRFVRNLRPSQVEFRCVGIDLNAKDVDRA